MKYQMGIKLPILATIIALSLSLSGCLAAAVGAGAAGGYYVANNYSIEKKKSSTQPAPTTAATEKNSDQFGNYGS